MKLLLESFVTGIEPNLLDNASLSGILPPLAEMGYGLDLDFSLLLGADTLVYDRTSLDLLKFYKSPATATIRESIERLVDLGLVELQDYARIVASQRGSLDVAVEQAASESLETWLAAINSNLTNYNAILFMLERAFGADISEWDRQIFPIANFLVKNQKVITPRRIGRLKKLLQLSPDKRRDSDVETLNGLVREPIAHTLENMILADALAAAPYTWSTQEEYYRKMYRIATSNVRASETHVEGGRNFFDLAFPEYRPQTREDWLRILSDKHLADLKAKINEEIIKGRSIDREFGVLERDAYISDVEKLNQKKSLIGWVADGSSLGIGVASALVAGAAAVLATPAAGAAMAIAGAAITVGGREIKLRTEQNKFNKKYSWMYFRTRSGHQDLST